MNLIDPCGCTIDYLPDLVDRPLQLALCLLHAKGWTAVAGARGPIVDSMRSKMGRSLFTNSTVMHRWFGYYLPNTTLDKTEIGVYTPNYDRANI